MLDLLLINAPSHPQVYQGLAADFAAIEPPVWAGLIAQHCLNAKFTVQILDAEAEGLTVQQTATEIVARNPRLAVFCIYGQQPSASTQCLPAASAVCKLVKGAAPNIPTLALGTHASALPEKTVREEAFDYVVAGEGLTTTVRMLNDLRLDQPSGGTGTPFTREFQWPIGLYSRNSPTRIYDPYETNISDLNHTLPGQAWELLDMTRYRAHNWHLWTAGREKEVIIDNFRAIPTGRTRSAGGYASVQTSLGCPFKCSFCCINAPFGGSGIRYWSPENVVAQIINLVHEYGITNIKIPDEMFVLNRQHVWRICNGLIDNHLGDVLNIWAYARIDTVKDVQLLDKMRQAGFRWLGLGIESGSKHVREGAEKGKFGDDDIMAAVQRVHDADICVGANYIFGLPDDTHESMQQTLDLACEINAEWANFYCAMAYPGSALHRHFSQHNPRALPENNPCGWLGYAQHAYECLPLPTDTVSAQEVLDFRDAAFLKYFQRQEYQDMIRAKFGDRVVTEVKQMLSLGKPPRQHRKDSALEQVGVILTPVATPTGTLNPFDDAEGRN